MAEDFDAPLDDFRGVRGVKVLIDAHTLLWAAGDHLNADEAVDRYGVMRIW